MIDLIALLIIIFFTLAGLRKGFWQYLAELLTIPISLGVAWYYYQSRHGIFKSIFIFVWVFLGLALLRWLLLGARQKKAPQKEYFLFGNRFCGAILGLAWGIFITLLFVLTIDLLPCEAVFKYNIKEKVQLSRARQITRRLIPIKEIGILENISYISKVNLDKNAKIKLWEQPEAQELLEYAPFKAVMEDPETLKQLQNKDLRGLLANPKIHKLLNDGQFIEKLLRLNLKKAAE